MHARHAVSFIAAAILLGACAAQPEPAPSTTTVVRAEPADDGAAERGAIRSAHALLIHHLRNVAGTPAAPGDKVFLHQAELAAGTAARGQVIRWHNPSSAHSGAVEVLGAGDACRAYRTSITIDGQTHSAVGSACANGGVHTVGASLGTKLG